MSRSILLQLARDSIQEVFEAQRTIDRTSLLASHPLLSEHIKSTIKLYLYGDLRGASVSASNKRSLLEDIIYNAKKSAFEDKNFSPLTTSEYLSCEIEIVLETPDGVISEKDLPILKEKK